MFLKFLLILKIFYTSSSTKRCHFSICDIKSYSNIIKYSAMNISKILLGANTSGMKTQYTELF